ncbi:hypothetical protein HN51_045649 [Arachis hypogaea]
MTSSVVPWVTAFAATVCGEINLLVDKRLSLAKFLLGIGVPGDAIEVANLSEMLTLLTEMCHLQDRWMLKAVLQFITECSIYKRNINMSAY